MLFPLIGAAVGIVAIAGIIKFACDELSEEEEARQQELIQRFDEDKRRTDLHLAEIENEKDRRMSEIKQRYGNQYNAEREEIQKLISYEYAKALQLLNADKCQIRSKLVDAYIVVAEDRECYATSLQKDIKSAISTIIEQEKGCKTLARKNALRHFKRELCETKEKSKAYENYVKQYVKYIRNSCKDPDASLELVAFILPKNYLYKGKTVMLQKHEMQRGEIAIACCYPLKFSVGTNIDGIQDDGPYATFCEGFDYRNYVYNLSLEKGLFKSVALSSPQIGLSARVEQSNGREYTLSAHGITMKLYWGNLEDPNRKPPVGAELRVFPIDWDVSLHNIYVSEKASDALHSFSFDRLPIIFSEDGRTEFEKFLSRKDLLKSTDEWKIAPFSESDLPNFTQVKFQLGTSAVLLASIEQFDSTCCFSYQRILEYTEYSIKPEDVFAVIDCVLLCVADEDRLLISESVYANMHDLALFVFSEFKNQYSIKINQSGMLYYNKWSELLDRLITYKYKGDRLTVDIAEIDFSDLKGVWVTFKDPEKVNSFCEGVYESTFFKRGVAFFVEVQREKYVFVKKFRPDRAAAYFFGEDVLEFFTVGMKLTLYSQNSAYVESRQKRALVAFRMGELANRQLQSAAMDGSAISSEPTGISVANFYDQLLFEDTSQREAVKRAMDEKNIFLIQGPPGTGKTTVIIEMIRQIIDGVSARVLVVSQANVAVDNVLKRLVDDYTPQIIRCGSANRISDEIYPVSYELCYKNYVNALMEKKGEANVNQTLLERWLMIVAPERGSNSDVGELILRSRKVIGATCIGLANKGLGIDRITFDLVIIDEAGKALPGEILVPYIRAKKILLIGDHKQLPPVIDPALRDDEKIELEGREQFEEPLFDESFFARLWRNAPETNKIMLTKQYRMPASIGQLISSIFYSNELENGKVTTTKLSLIPSMPNNITMLDMSKEKLYCEKVEGGVTNEQEAITVQKLLVWLKKDISEFDDLHIALITPYKAQKRLIKKAVMSLSENFDNVAIDTVDAFQGDEAEIVVYCTTRAVRPTKYFADFRRVNVALSRAKNNLIIIGSMQYFRTYRSDASPLPDVAQYISDYGEIRSANFLNCVSVKHTRENIDYIPPSSIEGTYTKNESDSEFMRILNHLRENFERTGALAPIQVKKTGDKYELVDGYKRLILAKQLDLPEIEIVLI